MSEMIRSLCLPDDYEGISAVLNTWLSEPVTVERLMEEDRIIPDEDKYKRNDNGRLAGYGRLRVAACDSQGTVVGYGTSTRAGWTGEGELFHTLVVAPQWQSKGIGNSILDCLEEYAKTIGADYLTHSVRETDDRALAFAKKRGYEIERASFESKLELPFVKRELFRVIESVQDTGIRFFTFADDNREESERKLYELYAQTHPDIPGFSGKYKNFEWWRKWTIEIADFRPETMLIAADGERYVGLVHLIWNKETQSMYHEYTCMDREYRGRRIALALKLLAVQLAERFGARYLRTHNDSKNGPMLHINRDILGFEAEPGFYKMVKCL